MVELAWLLVIVLFIVGMVGTVYPIIPGTLAIYAAFFVYGYMVSFEAFGFWFWFIQTTIVVILFIADYWISALGVKKFGGSRASIIGSTIGLIVGPFVIPVVGLIAGPFLGAWIGEFIVYRDPMRSTKAGVGALVGFFTSVIVKVILQLIMIAVFFLWVF